MSAAKELRALLRIFEDTGYGFLAVKDWLGDNAEALLELIEAAEPVYNFFSRIHPPPAPDRRGRVPETSHQILLENLRAALDKLREGACKSERYGLAALLEGDEDD